MAIITCSTPNCGRSFLDTTGIRKLCHKCRRRARVNDNTCECCGLPPTEKCDCSIRLARFYETIRQQQGA